MDYPLVSIIMGVYNANRKMLRRAVNSILRQTYKNFEFIICDDASTNGTPEWLAELAAMDKRIKILHNADNLRLAATLNKCIKNARGEFLARQDDDDISDPTRLEKQVRFLLTHPEIDFVGCNCSLYNPKDGVFGERKMAEFPKAEDFLFNSPFIHGSLMFRRTCLNKDSNYCESKWTKRTEDYELFMRLYSEGKRAANIQENLYSYHYGRKQNHISMNYRVDEMVLRYRGFQSMHLLPKGLPYVIKPIVLGCMPDKLVSTLRDYRNSLLVPSY